MEVPSKIFLQVCGDCNQDDCKNCKFDDLVDNVTWCQDRIFPKDKEYLSKDKVMEILNNLQGQSFGFAWDVLKIAKNSIAGL